MQASQKMQVQEPSLSCKQNCKSAPVIKLAFRKILFKIPPRLAWNRGSTQSRKSLALAPRLECRGCLLQVDENQMGYRTAQDGPRYAQEKLERREKPRTSANLINVPAPTKSNAKRLFTVETTWLETKEEPGRTNLGLLQCSFSGPIVPYCQWSLALLEEDRQTKPEIHRHSATILCPYTWYKNEKPHRHTNYHTHTNQQLAGREEKCFSAF